MRPPPAAPSSAPPPPVRKRAFWGQLDRRAVRSVTYASLLVVLFVLFKSTEWLIDHYLAGSRNQSVFAGLAIALALAILFQLFHHRVEHAVEGWLRRGPMQRLAGLKALAQEVTLIQDRAGLQERVVERLDSLLGTAGSAIYLCEQPDSFSLACSTLTSSAASIPAQDPAVIHLRLRNEPTSPHTAGSSLAMPLLWPMRVRGRMIGFIAGGERARKESFEPDEIQAVNDLAQAVGTALALLDPALAGPEIAVANAPRDNLPVNLTPLIGREAAMAEVLGLLETTHLLTILGVGGMGKTRLSLEVALQARERYPHGVWFVELAQRTDPKLVVAEVAEVLSVREEAGRPLLTTLLKFLCKRRLLIVLDNCEHLVDACAQFAEAVRRTCPDVRIVATSREALNIAGELIWRVPSLGTPDPALSESTEQLAGYPAVRLFLARANEMSPGFRITESNAPAIAHICRHLDGIPLAIELAASSLKALGAEQLVGRLNDRFRILTGGSRTALPRHQTLRSLIDWSYELLSAPERAVFRQLSVFAGGWTLEAAEAVCLDEREGVPDVLHLLTHLVEKSLVLTDAQVSPPRYQMLETIRQYAREKFAEASDAEQVSDRHLSYFVRFAQAAEPHFFHPDQVHWYATADAERDNVRAALEWSLAHGRADAGMHLVNALHRYWVARLYWREAAGWLERLLQLPELAPQNQLRAKSLFVSGHIANYYDPVTAQRLAEESLRISRVLGDEPCIVNALWLIGWIHNPRLDGSAAPFYEESIRLANAIDYPFGAVHAYAWYGMYKVAMGEYEPAKPLLLKGIEWAHRLGGDVSLIGRCKGNLGQAEMLQGHFAQARGYLDESLALQVKADNQNGRAESLWLQGRLALREEDHARSVRCFKESLRLYRQYATSVWVTRAIAYLAIAYAACGQAPLAARLAGALSARDGKTGRLKADLGSVAAIGEYEAAVSMIHRPKELPALEASWNEGSRLGEEAAIALALEV